MAISLSSISRGKARRAPRIVLLGVQKIGKSTFAAKAPDAIFIPIRREEGVDEIDCAKFPVADSFAAVMECLQSLAEEDHNHKTIVIDSASTLEPLILKHMADEHKVAHYEDALGGYGKWKMESLKYWGELQSALDYLREAKGMASILIGHVRVKTFNDPMADPYDQYQFDLQDNAAAMFYRWADAILFCNRTLISRKVAIGKVDAKGKAQSQATHAVGTDKRRLFTDARPAHPGGCRFPMPYELPLEWAKFEEAMNKSRGGAVEIQSSGNPG